MRRLSSRRAILLATCAVALSIPLGVVIASHQFGDVPNTNPFHNDIAAIADAGVTTGCGGGNYCPQANVTREQMAAFMNRLGALGAGKTPVVNARRLNGLAASAFERNSAVITASVALPNDGARVLLDPRTGADVRVASFDGKVRIVNTSSTRRMLVAGIATFGANAPEAKIANLDAGDDATFAFQTLGAHYLDLSITLSAANAAQVRVSHLTCSVADVGGGPPAMLGCVLVG